MPCEQQFEDDWKPRQLETRHWTRKDIAFANALVREGLIDLDMVALRVGALDADPQVIDRIRDWIATHRQNLT